MRLLVAIVALGAAALGATPAAAGVPAPSCPDATAKVDTFATAGPGGLYWLENMGFDGRGGMWVSELVQSKLVRYDASGQPGVALDIPNPGASLLGPDGLMYAVFGDGFTGEAGVMRFDPAAATPVLEPFAAGLKMGNGAAFDGDGNLYVADTINGLVARVRPDGSTEPSFAAVGGADGVVRVGGKLYVTEFSDAESTILTVPIADPGASTPLTMLSPSASDGKLLDDAAIGFDGRLYVASNRGELIRVDLADGAACILASGLGPVDSVRFARGFPPFDDHDAFLTSQTGELTHVRITETAAPERPRIRLRVRPRRVPAGKRVRLRVRVTSPPPCRGGVLIADHRTNSRGRARFHIKFGRGRYTFVASKPGCRAGRARVYVRRSPRPSRGG